MNGGNCVFQFLNKQKKNKTENNKIVSESNFFPHLIEFSF